MRKSEITALALVAGLLLLAGRAAADTIVLKNHRTLEGRIIDRSEKAVTIQVGDAGTMTLRMREVESIAQDDHDGSRIVDYALRAGVTVHHEGHGPTGTSTPRPGASALREIAARPRDATTDLILFRAAPELIRRVAEDPERSVRLDANETLNAIAGRTVVKPIDAARGTGAPDLPQDAAATWNAWWSSVGSKVLAGLEQSAEPRESAAPPPRLGR